MNLPGKDPPYPALASHMLGTMGERLFETLCARAGLVCNRSDVDLTGWDFIVEYPADHQPSHEPLDRRQARSCHVQLKTTAKPGRVRMRLSAAARLAQDPRPAILVVLRTKANGDPICFYLIHLIGDQLARILKRLRVEHSKGLFDVNHRSLSFDFASIGERVAIDAHDLREALARVCGDDPARYIRDKQDQLERLGYDKGRFEADALMAVSDDRQLGRQAARTTGSSDGCCSESSPSSRSTTRYSTPASAFAWRPPRTPCP